MRVWLRKIHCPSSICFCKPAQRLYTPPPATFNSENSARGETAAVASVHLSAKKEEEAEVVVVGDHGEKVDETKLRSEIVLKSSIKRKKAVTAPGEEGGKKAVKWMDVAGKSLVHVKEFETSESEDTDSESEPNGGCICGIL